MAFLVHHFANNFFKTHFIITKHLLHTIIGKCETHVRRNTKQKTNHFEAILDLKNVWIENKCIDNDIFHILLSLHINVICIDLRSFSFCFVPLFICKFIKLKLNKFEADIAKHDNKLLFQENKKTKNNNYRCKKNKGSVKMKLGTF